MYPDASDVLNPASTRLACQKSIVPGCIDAVSSASTANVKIPRRASVMTTDGSESGSGPDPSPEPESSSPVMVLKKTSAGTPNGLLYLAAHGRCRPMPILSGQ